MFKTTFKKIEKRYKNRRNGTFRSFLEKSYIPSKSYRIRVYVLYVRYVRYLLLYLDIKIYLYYIYIKTILL